MDASSQGGPDQPATCREVCGLRKWAWGHGHIALFGAVAAVGAGLHVAAYAAEGETSIGTVGVVLAVAIPVLIFSLAYFALWSILFRAVDAFHVMLAVGYETAGYRHVEADVRREG